MPHPLAMHWYAETAPDGGYDYAFSLQVVEPFPGNVDGLVFADVGNGAPSNADALVNVSLIGPAPAPFTSLDVANGAHAGPLFENHPSAGWAPTGVGDRLDWAVHADGLADVLYWSTTRGDAPYADFELAINDCALATVAPRADRYQGVCIGLVKVCDAASHAFVEPDYRAIAGFEDVEASCDTLDNDCDGAVDAIGDPPLADVQTGVCDDARKVCASGAWVEPDYTALADFEGAEVTCDGADNDCDGTTDAADVESGIAAVPSPRQDGVCEGSIMACDGAGGLVEPDYAGIEGYEAVELTCDILDNDCNGATDEAIECAEMTAGCGCASRGASGGWLAAAGLLWMARRRPGYRE